MGKKKKGGKKKTKEVVQITDPEMLRLVGQPLAGTALTLTLFYQSLGNPISFVLKLDSTAHVHDMVRAFKKITGSTPQQQYIFVGKLRKSHQRTIMLPFDGGKVLTDHLGVEHGDALTFIEANPRMTRIYTERRMQCHLEHLLAKRTGMTAELIEKKKANALPETIANISAEIDLLTKEIHEYKEYALDPDIALQRLGTFKEGGPIEDPKADVPRVRKPFGALPVEEQQRLKNILTEGLDILRDNRALLEKEREKAEKAKNKKGKKKKK